MSSIRHESGKLKQSNKKHKGISKASVKRALGPGRTGGGSGPGSSSMSVTSRSTTAMEARNKRVSFDQQQKKQCRAEQYLKKRIGSNKGPPKLIGIIALSDLVNFQDFLENSLKDASWSSTNIVTDEQPLIHIEYAKHKSNVSLLFAQRSLSSAINVAKIADTLVFVAGIDPTDPDAIIDSKAHTILSTLRSIGLPETICFTQGLHLLSGKVLIEMKKLAHRHFESSVGTNIRFADDTDANILSRHLSAIIPKNLNWRNTRSYMLCESVEVVADDTHQSLSEEGKCSVKIGGYLRGQPLNVNALVHVSGGTFPISKISSALGPFESKSSSKHRVEMFESHHIVSNPEMQESLVIEATGDSILGEQTWPSEDELRHVDSLMAVGQGRERRTIPEHLPEGMSSYQADWFVDEDGEFKVEDGSDNGDELQYNDEDEDNRTVATSLRMEVQSGAVKKAREDMEFPDEMDTPRDIAARQRFARYRALQSFRSSLWHPKENLPQEYSKIFAFENFGMAQRRALTTIDSVSKMFNNELLNSNPKLASVSTKSRSSSFCASSVHESGEPNQRMDIAGHHDEGSVQYNPLPVTGSADHVKSGVYIEIEIRGVPIENVQYLEANIQNYMSLFGLLPDENKLSVLHFNVQLVDGQVPVKSKEPLLFHVGFRTFAAKPIFSEANLNCDKHKLERFLQPDRYVVASIYAPITYLPCPALIYRSNIDVDLVATGTLLSIDPDRIILKKTVLTGIPVRVRKRYGVVKHMFFDPQDVRWFKPAELYTKHGLRGNIKEPVGTHGLFKAVFSAPITQNDTVMLVLYKRVYPKMPSGQLVVG